MSLLIINVYSKRILSNVSGIDVSEPRGVEEEEEEGDHGSAAARAL